MVWCRHRAGDPGAPLRPRHRAPIVRALLPAALAAGLSGAPATAAPAPRVAHVFVALCDNVHQGIVPVPAALGDGDDAAGNLYWGARYGVRTYLERAPGWRRLLVQRRAEGPILERVVFRHRPTGLLLVADAYRGREIAQAMEDFLRAAAGRGPPERLALSGLEGPAEISIGDADLLAYVGHDGLMDAGNPAVAALLAALPEHARGAPERPVLVIACASRSFFAEPLRRAGAVPWLTASGLLAAEAYTLEAAVAAWARGAPPEVVREEAARAYAAHQRCSVHAARRLFGAAQPTAAPNALPTR
jgi:hypothetical protein